MSSSRFLFALFLVTALARAQKKDEKCACVPFYLCDINLNIYTQGEGILDPRVEVCDKGEVCCFLPGNKTEPTGGNNREGVPKPRPDTGVPVTSRPVVTEKPVVTVKPVKKPPPRPTVPQGPGCGLRRIIKSQLLDERISSENQAGYGEFPWMVMLYKEVNKAQKYLCGGSLIHPSVVLTAAHCLSKGNGEGESDLGEVKVRAGEWDTSETYEPSPPEERTVSRVVVHPEFEKETLINDLALLFLNEKLNTTDVIDSICVISEQLVNRINTSRCIVTGWGDKTFQEDNLQQILKYVTMPIVDHDECQKKLRTTRLSEYFRLHETFICAGGKLGQDSCTGDGGGPLICPLGDNAGRFVQLGIVSWGIGCASDIPGVYVSVTHYFKWINSVIHNILE